MEDLNNALKSLSNSWEKLLEMPTLEVLQMQDRRVCSCVHTCTPVIHALNPLIRAFILFFMRFSLI